MHRDHAGGAAAHHRILPVGQLLIAGDEQIPRIAPIEAGTLSLPGAAGHQLLGKATRIHAQVPPAAHAIGHAHHLGQGRGADEPAVLAKTLVGPLITWVSRLLRSSLHHRDEVGIPRGFPGKAGELVDRVAGDHQRSPQLSHEAIQQTWPVLQP